jgi:hypothetical protein
MKAHNINMVSAWAKSWGIKGYEHLDPQIREKQRQKGLQRHNERIRKEQQEKRPN